MMPSTLLDQIRSLVVVHVDSMDPQFALRHPLCCDMTSNQALVYLQATKPESAPLVKEAIAYVQGQTNSPESDPRTYLLNIVDVLTVLLAKQVYPHITGKVHAQTSPSTANDVERTKAHALKLASLFESHGIERSRSCIKIPATPEGITACKELQELGINTLATAVSSWEQCVAAMQADCVYAAPYFNELRVHFDPELRKEYVDPAREHPSSPGVRAGIAALKGSGTSVMPASIISVQEARLKIIALVSFRPGCITIPGHLLDALAALPELPAEQLEPSQEQGDNLASGGKIDYVANGSAALRDVFRDQPDIARRVAEAVAIFDTFEKKTMEFVRSGRIDIEWDGVSL